MIATIEIDCDGKDELLAHLYHVIEKVKDSNKDFDFDDIEFEDNNCYGTHTVKILQSNAAP